MQPLKLIALDQEDLKIVSAHLQDAVLRVGDMAYMPSQHRFAAIANRFDWEGAIAADGGNRKRFERRRTALRFDRVLGAQILNISLSATRAVVELLAINFDEVEPPSGVVTLVFAGGGAIRLQVECIEAELRDLGPAWTTRNKPAHTTGDDDQTSTET